MTAVLALSIVAGCSPGGAAVDDGSEGGAPHVKHSVVRAGSLDQIVTIQGGLRAATRATVSSPVGGVVSRVGVREGSAVVAGQPVIWLDSADLDNQVRQQEGAVEAAAARLRGLEAGSSLGGAQAASEVVQAEEAVRQADIAVQQRRISIEQTRRELASRLRLFQEEAISRRRVDEVEFRLRQEQEELNAALSRVSAAREVLRLARIRVERPQVRHSEVDAARAAVHQAQASLEAARLALSRCVLRAPITGVVLVRQVETGQTVGPGGNPLLLVVDNRRLEVVAPVDQHLATWLHRGMRALAYPSASSTSHYPAVIEGVMGEPDPQTDTVQVRLRVIDPRGQLLDGMRVHVRLTVPHRGLVVPRSALARHDGASVVYVVAGDRVHERAVTVVYETPKEVVVAGAVKSGDALVLDPPSSLAEGAQVDLAPGPR